MEYLLVAISVSSTVLQNSLFNAEGKRSLRGSGDRFFFNSSMYIVCFILFGLLALISGRFSVYSLCLGFVFGLLTSLANFTKLTALGKGPMHITVLITTSSMIIPALSGAILFNESFSIAKVIAIIALIGSIYVSLARSEDKSIKRGWLLCTVISFFSQGMIGVLQKIHQSSEYKDEQFLFLASAFLFSFAFSAIMGAVQGGGLQLCGRQYLIAALCGVCGVIMNYLNLTLSGVIPSQIFFPLVNGGAMILISLVSVLVFREKLVKRQIIGLVGGIISLIAICIL